MSSGNIVKLNIGGTIFQTSKSTLTKFDGFFKIMLETDIPLEKDDSGCIFIDRDPLHFRLILNYMRDGDVVLPNTEENILEIQKEAQYYLLIGLVDLCNAKIPADFPIKLRTIESDDQMLHIIANIKIKPVIIIFYFIGARELDRSPSPFRFEKFLEEYKNRFDIYFKPFHSNESQTSISSTYRIHDNGSTDSGFLTHLESYIARTYRS